MNFGQGAPVYSLGEQPSDSWMSPNGDELTLKNNDDETVDYVAWEQSGDEWNIAATTSESIARKTAGDDSNNNDDDFEVLTNPNPGTSN